MPGSRYLIYQQWRKGLAPNYRPTIADLYMLSLED